MFFGTSALKGFVFDRTSYGYLSFSGLTAFFSGDIWDDFVFKVYRIHRIHRILATLEKLRASSALKGQFFWNTDLNGFLRLSSQSSFSLVLDQ